MKPTKEQLTQVFREEEGSRIASIGKNTIAMATWLIRERLEMLDGNPKFTCDEIRKTLVQMVKDGTVYKHWSFTGGYSIWAFKGG